MTRYSRYSNEDVRQALDDIKGGKSLRKAASQWGVPRTTLQRRMQGAQSREIAFSEHQRLSQSQESNLAEWVRIQVVLGLSPTHQQIREFAERVLQIHGDSRPLGKNWVQSFIRRNPSFMGQKSKASAPQHIKRNSI